MNKRYLQRKRRRQRRNTTSAINEGAINKGTVIPALPLVGRAQGHGAFTEVPAITGGSTAR